MLSIVYVRVCVITPLGCQGASSLTCRLVDPQKKDTAEIHGCVFFIMTTSVLFFTQVNGEGTSLA